MFMLMQLLEDGDQQRRQTHGLHDVHQCSPIYLIISLTKVKEGSISGQIPVSVPNGQILDQQGTMLC
jgi:hypothetical protein